MIQPIPLKLTDIVSTEPAAILIVGVLALMLWAVVQFRNPAGGIMWGLSVLTLLVSAIYEIELELFTLSLILTAILLIIGVAARMSGGR